MGAGVKIHYLKAIALKVKALTQDTFFRNIEDRMKGQA